MLNNMIGYIQKMFAGFEKPATYGSEVEAYIVSKNPQNAGDVDRLMREFTQRTSMGWPV